MVSSPGYRVVGGVGIDGGLPGRLRSARRAGGGALVDVGSGVDPRGVTGVVGVGEIGIPLSPETIVLPRDVDDLPAAEASLRRLLDADAEALVNTVNTVGVMGRGIALQFKRAFPDNRAVQWGPV